MVLIFVHKSSPRLQYIAAFIFKELIKTPYSITSHKDSFANFEGIKINYTSEKISDDELHIHPHGLLNEEGIKERAVEVSEVNDYPALFKKKSDLEGFSFDIFSAAFYLLSRYEEYLPYKKDTYGRYSHTNSIAFKHSFLHLPLINIWVDDLLKMLQTKHAHLQFKQQAFKFIPTYDIDIAYSYLNKGFVRSAGAAVRSFFALQFKSLTERSKVLFSKKADPFDNYAWLNSIHDKFNLAPLYFFLVAHKNGQYDKNILPQTKAMQLLIKEHSVKYDIGIHPSWQSGDKENLLIEEKETIEKIVEKSITKNRQHYLRISMPATFRSLLKAGITDDYSMGYGTVNGFRASVASSFFWYDIEKEEQTKLRVHPFCYMDSTSIYQQKYLPQDAYDEMLQYYTVCKKYSATFICILHNHLLGIDKKKCRNVYERFLQKYFANL